MSAFPDFGSLFHIFFSQAHRAYEIFPRNSISLFVDLTWVWQDDKVGVVGNPGTDAAGLSGDLTRLLGTICSKIRRPSSASITTQIVIKPPLPLSGGPQGFQRSQSFDIRSSASLKLLLECCTDDLSLLDSSAAHKDRRTEGLGPHRHYYKPIRLPLEQKLKYVFSSIRCGISWPESEDCN